MGDPRIFRTSSGSYAALCGVLSMPLVIWCWVAFSSGRADPKVLLISLVLPSLAAMWLAYFRLRLDDIGLQYRDLFGTSFKVAYSEIAFLKSRAVSYGRGFGHEWILHLRDGRRLRLNLKPFPREVYGLLCQRVRCDA